MGTYDLGHQNFAVVIADTLRYAAEKLKSLSMSFPVTLCTFTLKRHNKKRIRKWQYHDKKRHLPQYPSNPCQSVTKINLPLSGPVTQRHEHFLIKVSDLTNRFFYLGISTSISHLLYPFIYPLGCMTLLLRINFVALNDLSNPLKKRANLWPGTGLFYLIAWRGRVNQYFLEGLPVNALST